MPLIDIFTFFISGFGAGLVTGLMGASAVIVAAPILIAVSGVVPYVAVGLSLATDVFASVTATAVYHRNRNIEVKRALPVLIFALAGVVIGSVVSIDFPSVLLGIAIGIGTIISGSATAFRRGGNSESFGSTSYLRTIIASVSGLVLGLIAGVFGAGGGIMILLVLTLVLGYRTHVAIGTSVLFMIIIALLGAGVHYIAVPFSVTALLLMAVGGVAGAGVSAAVANRLSDKTLRYVVGATIVILGIVLTTEKLLAV